MNETLMNTVKSFGAGVRFMTPLVALVLVSACGETSSQREEAVTLMRQTGCGSCHRIPGMDWADAPVGPSLYRYRQRAYIAGLLPNEKSNLVRFLVDPKAVHPRSAMPALGLSEGEATLIAQYLYDVQTD